MPLSLVSLFSRLLLLLSPLRALLVEAGEVHSVSQARGLAFSYTAWPTTMTQKVTLKVTAHIHSIKEKVHRRYLNYTKPATRGLLVVFTPILVYVAAELAWDPCETHVSVCHVNTLYFPSSLPLSSLSLSLSILSLQGAGGWGGGRRGAPPAWPRAPRQRVVGAAGQGAPRRGAADGRRVRHACHRSRKTSLLGETSPVFKFAAAS